MLLQTSVVPIEYDKNTKKRAYRLKQLLESNEEFFQAFLKDDEISLINPKSNIFIGRGESIFSKGLCLIPSTLAILICKKDKVPYQRSISALVWLNDYYDGKVEVDEKYQSTFHRLAAADYILNSGGTYQDLYDYYSGRLKLLSTDFIDYLNEEYRFSISEILINNSLDILKEVFFPNSSEIPLDLELISKSVLEIANPFLESTSLKTPMTKEESIFLFETFLKKIDKTNELQEVLKLMKEQGVWVEGNSPTSDWATTRKESGKKNIHCNFSNTIEDALALVHEFFHFYTLMYRDTNKNYLTSEVVPIYFEMLFASFLEELGYTGVKEARENRRKTTTALDAYCIYELLFLRNQAIKHSLSIEDELMLDEIRQQAPYYDEGIDTAKTFCDIRNKILITDPAQIAASTPYVIAYPLVKKLLEETEKDPNTVNIVLDKIRSGQKTADDEVLSTAKRLLSSYQKKKEV